MIKQPGLTLTILCLAWIARSAPAQVINFADLPASSGVKADSSYLDRLAELESRLDAMESFHPRVASLEQEIQRLPSITLQSRPFFYGGVEHVLVKPYFGRNIAFWDENIGPPPQDVNNFTSFDWEHHYTPRIFVGYQIANGTGIRARYWAFDGDSQFSRTEGATEDLYIETNLADATAFVDVTGTLIGRHSIQTHVIDLEITKRGDFGWGWVSGSGGFRYARLEQDARWDETGGPEFLILQHDFEGIGPTLGLEAGIPLLGGAISGFANGRTSLLFGNRSGFLTDDFPSQDNIPSYDALLPIIEAQVGLEWGTMIWGHTFKLRAAMEAQTWFGGGGASGGDDEGIPADQIDMGFFGASFSSIIEL